MQENSSHTQSRPVIVFLVVLLCVRALGAGVVPIMDETEARYAEIARKMVETGNWIGLQFDYGVPFWGKPPLSTWLSAAGIAVFGPNEFGPRAPILLLSTVLLILFWRFVKETADASTAHLATLMLSTSAIFFVSAGAVMTDMALTFSLFLLMSACWRFTRDWNPRHGLWMFAAFGLGLLAKGLMILVAGGLPIAVWLTLTKNWKPFCARLPWIPGLVTAAVIALPWYIAAEVNTPGFLNYFFIGEHFKRFLVPGWEGDRYGYTHAQPYGMIWLFYLMGSLPWSVLVPACLLIKRRRPEWLTFGKDVKRHQLALFLLCWVAAPAVLLTFARNIIWTYSLPATLPLSILFAMSLQGIPSGKATPGCDPRKVMGTSWVVLGVAVAAGGFLLQNPQWVSQVTYKPFVEEFKTLCPDNTCRLWCFGERIHSAEYYMQGQTRRIELIHPFFQEPDREKHFIIGLRTVVNRLHPSEREKLVPIKLAGKVGLWRLKPRVE